MESVKTNAELGKNSEEGKSTSDGTTRGKFCTEGKHFSGDLEKHRIWSNMKNTGHLGGKHLVL